MLTSLRHLLRATLKHWYQLLGGTAMAIIGLLGDIKEWPIPGWIWGTLAYLMLLWAVLAAYHDLRLSCDAAMDGLRDMVDHQGLADALTEKCADAKQRLVTTRNNQLVTDQFRSDTLEWFEQVHQILENHRCTLQEINHFHHVTVDDTAAHPRKNGVMKQLLIRMDRAADISTHHAQIAERLRLAARLGSK
jgi:hypothetical protein